MADLTEYERLGDLDGPFGLTAKHERVQRERERLRDVVRCDVVSLTYENYMAGLPCPGCGRPYLDKERWDFRGTINMTPEERARYDAEDSRYKAAHGSCGSHRHSVSGSLTTHFGKCCPPPPLSPTQTDRLRQLLGRATSPHELMRWRLRLYCGHIVERQGHFTHKTLHAAFTGSVACFECGLDPATIVDGAAVGLASGPADASRSVPVRGPRKTRADLEATVRELEAEVKRLQQRKVD